MRLDRDQIQCELTATERVGVHRYTFPPNQTKGSLLIDLRHRDTVLNAHLEVVNDHEIAGYRISSGWAKEQHVYFVARFSTPFFNSIILDMAKNPMVADPSVTSQAIIGVLNFYNGPEPLVVTVGISGVSMEGARRNLEAECPDFDFNRIKTETQAKWQRQLAKITVEGGSKDQKTIFYTALYHTMVAPNIWNDVDGQYRGRDNRIHPNPGHDVYTVFSLWDTHRALHPLLTILEPRRTNDFIQTFLRQYEQGGLLPVWELAANETDCMIGNHAVSVITDAYINGIHGFDTNEALHAMLTSTNQNRLGMDAYRTLGYVPADKEPESVSKTLEYAYDDWCVAVMAGLMNRDSLAAVYAQRAQSYKNLFDPATGFFRAKANARWYEPFDPYEVNFNYTEANAWQYRFAMPQDIGSFITLLGGKAAFAQQLDSLFTAKNQTSGRNQADITGMIGQYVQGNEPSHHIAYLYNYAGQPAKTQYYIRQIMDTQYANRPDGLSGNEDCGQMSAWLVFSAMGFYPVLPTQPVYTVGTPWFEKIDLHLDSGKTFTINAKGVSAQRFYVRKVSRGSADSNQPYVVYSQLQSGGQLNFDMTDQPINSPGIWNASSLTISDILLPLPFVAAGKRVFKDRQEIALGSIDSSAIIYYQLLPAKPTRKPAPVRRYIKPFKVSESGRILLWAAKNDQVSKTDTFRFQRLQNLVTQVRYNTAYSAQYTAHGDNGLIDGIRGGADFRTGDWQGFEGVDLDVVLDLGKSKKIKQLSVGFLQDENAWIFFPKALQIEVSIDGVHFEPVDGVNNDVPTQAKGVLQKDFTVHFPVRKTRYIRVRGLSLQQCPPGHKGAGHPCWVFADEVLVE